MQSNTISRPLEGVVRSAIESNCSDSARRKGVGGAAALVSLLMLGVRPVCAQDRAGVDAYEQTVRPLLAKRCYPCHSSKSPQPAGGLRLDRPSDWMRGGRSGAALAPGNPDASLIIRAVRADGASAMPPDGPLSSEEIAALTYWIRRGAPAPPGASPQKPQTGSWWAVQPLRPGELPKVLTPGWCRTPIDRFVLAELERRGMRPAPAADRRTLLRRVSYDLIGLPPTPSETAAFLADRSPNAYEKVVDRLLASPHYGERWARRWLDLVHYGDTHGYDKDKRRDHAWHYRDYVIRAFNRDTPFRRFLREQIAGDVLYPNTPDGVIATGMLASGPWDFVGQAELAEGTLEKEKTRLLDRDDMVSTVMATFNSVTIHCARCHDHKFDPISQRDYYRLQAVFAGIDRGDRPFAAADVMKRRAALVGREKDLRARSEALRRVLAATADATLQRLDVDIASARTEQAGFLTQTAGEPSPTNGYHSGIENRPDVRKWVQIDLGRSLPIDRVTLIPARPTDFADTPGFGFPLRYRVLASDDPQFAASTTLLDRTETDQANPGPIPVTIEAHGRSARYVRVVAERLWKRTADYVFALAELRVESQGRNAAAGAKVTALDSIEQGRWSARYLVDGFDSRNRLPNFSDPEQARALKELARINERINRLERERSEHFEAILTPDLRRERAAVGLEEAEIADEKRRLADTDLVYAVLPRAPRPIHILARGEVERPLEVVDPGALSCLASLPAGFNCPPNDEGARRAALAEWLASPKNPLTWRSIVNRVWAAHFGQGIVDTPNDFGRNGGKPTHPALLDWLACWFRNRACGHNEAAAVAGSGGDFKALHRMMVLSAVYRQASLSRQDYAARDAENRLLWRMNRQRLDAEQVRDSILAVCGNLNLTLGGPGFDLFRFKDDHSPIYDYAAPGLADRPETWRRTIYAFSVRSVRNPFLESLDSADPNLPTPVRTTTITALQALSMMNDPFILRQAALLAQRLQRERAVLGQQIDLAYALLLARRPTDAERLQLTGYATKRGMAAACRVLFNTSEFLFID